VPGLIDIVAAVDSGCAIGEKHLDVFNSQGHAILLVALDLPPTSPP